MLAIDIQYSYNRVEKQFLSQYAFILQLIIMNGTKSKHGMATYVINNKYVHEEALYISVTAFKKSNLS
jgi:hypothetical protein